VSHQLLAEWQVAVGSGLVSHCLARINCGWKSGEAAVQARWRRSRSSTWCLVQLPVYRGVDQ
jgi:hypothetical protein